MRYALLALLLLSASPLWAQQADSGTHIGIGVRVNDVFGSLISFDEGFIGGGTTLLVPININGRFKLEPELGFGRNSTDGDDFEISTSQFTVGVGILAMAPRGDFALYGGGRLRYTKFTQELDFGGFGGSREQSSSSFGIAPVVGGEHFFSRWFSLGAEAGIEYRTFGSEEDGDEDDADRSSIATLGSVFARFYFN
jgi:hypothetical protein